MLGKGKHLALEVENLKSNEIQLLIHDCTVIQWQEQETEPNRAGYNIMFSIYWGILRFQKNFSWARRKLKPQQFHRTQTSLFFFCPSKRAPSQEKWDWVFQLTNYLPEDFLSMESGVDRTPLGSLPWTEFCTSVSDPLSREKKDSSFLSPHPGFSFVPPSLEDFFPVILTVSCEEVFQEDFITSFVSLCMWLVKQPIFHKLVWITHWAPGFLQSL